MIVEDDADVISVRCLVDDRHLAPSHFFDRDRMVDAELNCLAGDRNGGLGIPS
jgi:hypothetical protein